MDKFEFETILETHRRVIERFVYYKTPSKADGDDVLQEVYLSAYRNCESLADVTKFKAWILKIAANKCNDFYRERAKNLNIPYDDITENDISDSRYGISVRNVVRNTLDLLSENDKLILYLYYFKNKPQAKIANQLGIPIGTVKSRLHKARQNFKNSYPHPPILKGDNNMIKTNLPNIMPQYRITKSDIESFEVKWEEVMGWFMIPKLGEKLNWAMYDQPQGKMTEFVSMSVTGKAEVHGIEGVEIKSKEMELRDEKNIRFGEMTDGMERTFVAQLTDTHCRLLAESHFENGVKKCYTFLDGDSFLENWGFGEDNCGNEINIRQKGIIKRDGDKIIHEDKPSLLDIVGRYSVEMDGKIHDTVLVMDSNTYNTGVMSETYLDKSGRTVLWRRFNADNWAISHYGNQLWSERLPNNERVYINDRMYVHWYDCLTEDARLF